MLLGWICSIWESTKKSSSAMTSEGLNFCIWKDEILRYFLFCASLWLLAFFSPVRPLSCAFGLCYATVGSSLAFVRRLKSLWASAVRMPALFSCQDLSRALTAEAQHAPCNLPLDRLLWLLPSSLTFSSGSHFYHLIVLQPHGWQ